MLSPWIKQRIVRSTLFLFHRLSEPPAVMRACPWPRVSLNQERTLATIMAILIKPNSPKAIIGARQVAYFVSSTPASDEPTNPPMP